MAETSRLWIPKLTPWGAVGVPPSRACAVDVGGRGLRHLQCIPRHWQHWWSALALLHSHCAGACPMGTAARSECAAHSFREIIHGMRSRMRDLRSTGTCLKDNVCMKHSNTGTKSSPGRTSTRATRANPREASCYLCRRNSLPACCLDLVRILLLVVIPVRT